MTRTSSPFEFQSAGNAKGSVSQAVKLLGGQAAWKKAPTNRLQVHEAIRRGFPGKTLTYMVQNAVDIPSNKVFDVIGISRRTVQRRASRPGEPLSQDQSNRLWKFAEIFSATIELFGGRGAAAHWLTSPSLALEQKAPVDLMTTHAGAELVEQLLGRLEHGVYT